jgi:hypothetical protein
MITHAQTVWIVPCTVDAVTTTPWRSQEMDREKKTDSNQAKAGEALEKRKHDRSSPWPQESVPAKSREQSQDAEDDEIDLLHPPTSTKAQRTNRLLPGIIAWPRDPFKQKGCRKQEASTPLQLTSPNVRGNRKLFMSPDEDPSDSTEIGVGSEIFSIGFPCPGKALLPMFLSPCEESHIQT